MEELLDQIKEKEGKVEALAAQVEGLTDAVKRSLAEMENVRQRTAREVSNAKKYGVQVSPGASLVARGAACATAWPERA